MNLRILLFALISALTFSSLSAAETGCTDPLATNYKQSATENDGSCVYIDTIISPVSSLELPADVNETSGLMFWNNKLWTHNDSGNNTNLYAIDSISGKVLQSFKLLRAKNVDWEEITQDKDYIYLGDFGNNNGNRQDLRIVKIPKVKMFTLAPRLDTIQFSYSNQTDFVSPGAHKTNFDCEAMIVTADSIYLFTKQWVANKTSIYSLSKSPGTQVAKLITTFNVHGLITGASFMEDKRIIALTGYTTLLQPFIYLLYDFKGTDFFGGNKRRMPLSLMFHQVEAIATTDGKKYYISNESFAKQPYFSTVQKLHTLDLGFCLSDYLSSIK